jgi:hypothetical protein
MVASRVSDFRPDDSRFLEASSLGGVATARGATGRRAAMVDIFAPHLTRIPREKDDADPGPVRIRARVAEAGAAASDIATETREREGRLRVDAVGERARQSSGGESRGTRGRNRDRWNNY